MSYSNNLYKYIPPGSWLAQCPLSSIRVLVCVWKTYYYYCIINKEDVQACLVSICIMYVPLSKIERNSQNIVLCLGLISDIYICMYFCSTSWNFSPGFTSLYHFYLKTPVSSKKRNFLSFLFVWVCLFKFPHLHKLLEYYFKRLSRRLCKTYNITSYKDLI